MNNFCTLFNSVYLSRGIALYRSLLKTTNNFHLYIFAFDDIVYEYFTTTQLAHITVISLKEFETKELLEIKNTRSIGEYCWTCTPSTILHCLSNYQLEECTYLDADLYFFQDPTILLSELQNNSVLITDHRYTKKYDQAATSGKYCVQFLTFKNDVGGIQALNWWKDKCIEWCFARFEDNKFGDQKYLDDWPVRFNGVHELKHLGGGVAPWNCQQYKLKKIDNNEIVLVEKKSGKEFNLIFYHFHHFNITAKDEIDFGPYDINSHFLKSIYGIYVETILSIENELSKEVLTKNINHRKDRKYPKNPIWKFIKELVIRVKFTKKINFFIKKR